MLPDASPGLLADITVIEAGTRTGARYCGRLLADLGAQTVRLAIGESEAQPGYESYLDRGKRVLQIRPVDGLAEELSTASAGRIVIVCDNDDAAFLVAARAARLDNPRLLLIVLSDYGLDGPLAGSPSTDFTLQAQGGVSAVHPTGDRPPVAAGAELSELAAGAAAATGLLSALLMDEAGAPRADSAEADVDVSRFEAVLALAQYPWMWSEVDCGLPYQVPFMAVPGVEQAADGWVCAVAVTDPQWKAFRELAGVSALDDPRFHSLPARNALAEEVTALVRRYTAQHGVAELVELGAGARVPITPVTTPRTLPDAAPYASRNFFRRVEDGRREPGPIFRVSEAPPVESAIAPRVHSLVEEPRLPLRGVRVVEFGTFQAGPLVGCALAALGADVVKVEAVNRPDLVRWGPVQAGSSRIWERSVGFLGANLGKRDITLDLTDPESRDLLAELIARSDVVLDNFLPRVLDSFGLDYAGVADLSPNVVMARMPAWGSSGDWRDRPGFTYSVNATGGLADLTGYPDASPLLTGTIIDPFAAMHSTTAVLAAIRRQRNTGRGCHIEIPLCDVAAHLTARAVTATTDGHVPTRRGNHSDTAAPQGLYRTSDESWLALSVCGDEQWHSACTVLGFDASDCRYAGHDARVAHAVELDERIAVACSARTVGSLVQALLDGGVPAAELSTGVDAATNAQLLSRQRVFEVEHAVAGRLHNLAAPARIAAAPAATPAGPAPLFGEHNREVLTELGVSEATIERMYAEGKLGRSPWGLPLEP